ncbi:MAG: pantetheine-phosphate adenylyltransferase [Deltaproteobacteria bacterium]|nr:pantetheine-phosphate adenylyltransferase [Deltaproteobacteria bacterium]
MKIAVYPGSFDPPTEGHLNIIERGLNLFDKIIVVVAVNSSKNRLLTVEERVQLLREIFKKFPAVEVDSFKDELLVKYAQSRKATAILRGLRTLQDYEYEFQMALTNKKLAPAIETVFMMTEPQYAHVSSTLIREVARLGGSVSGMVPNAVQKKLNKKRERKK